MRIRIFGILSGNRKARGLDSEGFAASRCQDKRHWIIDEYLIFPNVGRKRIGSDSPRRGQDEIVFTQRVVIFLAEGLYEEYANYSRARI